MNFQISYTFRPKSACSDVTKPMQFKSFPTDHIYILKGGKLMPEKVYNNERRCHRRFLSLVCRILDRGLGHFFATRSQWQVNHHRQWVIGLTRKSTANKRWGRMHSYQNPTSEQFMVWYRTNRWGRAFKRCFGWKGVSVNDCCVSTKCCPH